MRAEAQAEERILRDLVGEMSDKGIFETFRCVLSFSCTACDFLLTSWCAPLLYSLV